MGFSVPEFAMRYILSNETNIFIAASSTSAQRLQINLHAANNPLSMKDTKYLEA